MVNERDNHKPADTLNYSAFRVAANIARTATYLGISDFMDFQHEGTCEKIREQPRLARVKK